MLSRRTIRGPATGFFHTPVCTVRPRQVTSCGIPTLTDSNAPARDPIVITRSFSVRRPGAVRPGPGEDRDSRRLLAPPGDLGLIDRPGRQYRIGPDHQVEHVGQPVWRVDPPPAVGLLADAGADGGGLERVDGRLAGLVRTAVDAVLLHVPQMHPGLVADLDRHGQVTEALLPGLDDRVLGRPGQVGAVEVDQVVVE